MAITNIRYAFSLEPPRKTIFIIDGLDTPEYIRELFVEECGDFMTAGEQGILPSPHLYGFCVNIRNFSIDRLPDILGLGANFDKVVGLTLTVDTSFVLPLLRDAKSIWPKLQTLEIRYIPPDHSMLRFRYDIKKNLIIATMTVRDGLDILLIRQSDIANLVSLQRFVKLALVLQSARDDLCVGGLLELEAKWPEQNDSALMIGSSPSPVDDPRRQVVEAACRLVGIPFQWDAYKGYRAELQAGVTKVCAERITTSTK
ncbi:hypothetical protein K435DRAFT_835785 [Dendrothele bispora CBS 962.96]|uniref:Uncharacterized protein n=1 Tax=Dendrothele bispora (strain CBS 962.96) TaxID=1314807 RepID=A0A4S8MKW7_DENBC|nr:hypothetical protein K435DRAFT_835785 [Dendrothele bispora CBS 962.96]